MTRIAAAVKIVEDSLAREQEAVDLAIVLDLCGRAPFFRSPALRFERFFLSFDRFTFPASGHGPILMSVATDVNPLSAIRLKARKAATRSAPRACGWRPVSFVVPSRVLSGIRAGRFPFTYLFRKRKGTGLAPGELFSGVLDAQYRYQQARHLVLTQRLHRIDAACAAGGEKRRAECSKHEQRDHECVA